MMNAESEGIWKDMLVPWQRNDFDTSLNALKEITGTLSRDGRCRSLDLNQAYIILVVPLGSAICLLSLQLFITSVTSRP
jgi:hypothetical protein